MVTGAVERWLTTEKNVSNNSTTPDIALFIVVLVENFRGNVVGSSKFLIKGLVRVIDKRGSEVDDLDLVELLISLKKDVLWF